MRSMQLRPALLRRASIVCYSIILICKDTSVVGENQEGAKGDTVPVTYHRLKTLISLHYIATRENSKRV